MTLQDLLAAAGYQVFVAARVGDALDIARREHIDCAVLDINLHGEQVYPVCEWLRAHDVAFVFTSAYEGRCIPKTFRNRPMVQKPYLAENIMRAVASLLGREDTALATAGTSRTSS